MTDLAPLIDVTEVRVLSRYVVELTFAEEGQRVIDLEPLLCGPMFEPLLADYHLVRDVTGRPGCRDHRVAVRRRQLPSDTVR